MKTAAFVPIKLNNQRTPGKNIRRFDDGTPLLTLFLKTLVQVRGLDEIYVFCSNPSINEYLIPGVTFLKRPGFLDLDSSNATQLIEEFMKIVAADIYAMCHCTSPFVTVAHMEDCVNATKSGEYDSAFPAQKIQHFLWKSNNEPLNFDPSNMIRTQDLEPIYYEVSAAHLFLKEVFVKYRKRVGLKPYIVEVSGVECIDIDYPEDFEIANALYMKLLKGSGTFA